MGTPVSAAPNPLAGRIGEILALDPTAPALEFEHRWYTWGELGATVDAVADLAGT